MPDVTLSVAAEIDGSISNAKDVLNDIKRLIGDMPSLKIDVDSSELDNVKASIKAINSSVKDSSSGNFMRGVSSGAKSANAQLSETVRQINDVKSKIKALNISDSNLTSSYKKLDKTLGSSSAQQDIADLEALRVKYIELQTVTANLKSTNAEFVTDDDIQKVAKLQSEFQELISTVQKRISNDATKREIEDYKKYISIVNECNSAIKNFSQAQKSSNTSSNSAYSNLQAYSEQLKNLKARLDSGKISAKEFNDAVKEISSGVQSNKATIIANGDNTMTWLDQYSGIFEKISQYISVQRVLSTAVNTIKKMASNVIEVDSAMTELKKVTDETDNTYNSFLDNASSRAKELGASLSDTITATADFARLGYDIDESSSLADAAIIYKNVGDDIADISAASDSIVSTMQAFNVLPEDAMSIVDKFNEVGNSFAISSDGIGEALQRSASSLSAAGNTLDESIALVTAANEVVQNPETVGTTMKTISMYLRAASTEAKAAGESTDGMASSVSDLRKELLQLTGDKVDIQIDSGTFKSTYQILKELSSVWGELTDISRANITELIGGKRNSNVISALMNNFSQAEKVLQTSLDSDGSATKENEKYLDSVQGKLDVLEASWQTLSNDFLDSDLLKGGVSALTGLVDVLDDASKILGVFGQAFVGIQFGKFSLGLASATTNIKAFSTAASGIAALQPALLAITGVYAAIDLYRNYKLGLVEEAEEAGVAWSESNNSLNGYIERITELRGQLDSGTLSEQEAYAAKSELLSIQEALTESYGEQASGIDLANGSLKEQIELINQLNQYDANKYLNENSSGIDEATKQMEKKRTEFLGSFFDSGDEESKAIQEAISESQKKYGDLITTEDNNGEQLIYFNGDVSQAEEVLNDFLSSLRESYNSLGLDENDGSGLLGLFSIESPLEGIMGYAEDQIQSTNDILDAYQATYEYAKQAALVADSTLYSDESGKSETAAKWLNNYSKAIEDYNNALASGDTSKITEAKEAYDAVDKSVQSLVSGDMSRYSDQFSEIGNQLNTSAIALNDFKSAISGADMSDTTKDINEFAEAIKSKDLSDLDFKYAFETEGEQECEDQINAIVEAALNAGVISDTSSSSIQSLVDVLVELGIVSGETSSSLNSLSVEDFKTDITDSISKLNSLNDIFDSANSTTGLTIDQVDTLVNSYKDLTDTSGDAYGKQRILSSLFARTASGIRLNTREAELFNKQLELTTKQEFYGDGTEENIGRIREAMNALQNAIDTEADPETISSLRAELETVQLLAAEYEGATSKFQKWTDAQSSENAGDNYRSLNSSGGTGMIAEAEKLYSEYRTNTDDFRAAANYFSYKDLAGASQKAVEDAWVKSAHARDRYFTGTAKGINNFMDDMEAAGKELGKEWTTLDKDGKMHFNTGTDEEIAEHFGISVEAVQDLLKAASEYNEDIVVGDTSGFDEAAASVDNYTTSLKDLQSAGEISADIDLDFDAASMSVDDIDSKIKELIAEENRIKLECDDGSADQAIEALNAEINALTNQKHVMQIQAAMDETGATIEQIKEWSDEDIIAHIGCEADEVDEVRAEIESMSSDSVDIPVTVKLDETQLSTITAALNSISGTASMEVDANVPEAPEVPDGVMNVQVQTDGTPNIDNTATVSVTADVVNTPTVPPTDMTVTAIPSTEAVDGYTPEEKESTVVFDKDSSEPDGYEPKDKEATVDYILGATPSYNPSNIQRTLTYVIKTSGSVPSSSSKSVSVATGTLSSALADGTAYNVGNYLRVTPAYANGKVALSKDEQALVNELGTESIIRDGIWSLIPGQMHMQNLKKGDIVLNAKQTKDLLNHGKTNDHARALASGTLSVGSYSSGSWKKIPTTRRSSSSSSSRSSSGSSSRSSGSSSRGSGSSSSSSSNSSSTKKDEKEKIDWIEILISRLERTIDRAATKAESTFRTLTSRLKNTSKEMSTIKKELSVQEKGYDRYIKEARSISLSSSTKKKVRNGTIDINSYGESDRKKIEEYQKWYEKAIACKDAILDLNEALGELYQSKFDDVATDYENKISMIEHATTTYSNGIDYLEEKGYLASAKYYTALQNTESKKLATLQKERNDLRKRLNSAVESGYIKRGSEAWYDMKLQIKEVTESIQESKTAVVEYANEARKVKWDKFDYFQEQISNITDESDFLIDLMSSDDLFTDNGQFNKLGKATAALHAQNYDVYMAQANKYADEISKINKEIAKDPYNTTLLDRRQELLESQRESILAAEDEKDAIKDLVEEGIQIELDALQDLIDKYNDSLDTAKDLYEYNESVKDQAKEISTLQKQLSAYAGDDSEETKSTVQKLRTDLADAQKSLEEKQFDRYISEQKNLLSDLYDQYEELANKRLDDTDALLKDIVSEVNNGASSIKSTLSSEAKGVGTTLSASLKTIWSSNKPVTSVGTKADTAETGTADAIKDVKNDVNKAASKSDKLAEQTKKNLANEDSKDSSGKKTKLTSTIKKGVAAAILVKGNKTSGWGSGDTRKKRLKNKFGSDGTKVQDYLTKHKSDGTLNKWWKKNGSKKYYYSAFKTGGLADYTGLAQLDGTPTKPELVLNAEDTKNFIALKDALRNVANGDNSLIDALAKNDGASVLNNLLKTSPLVDVSSSGTSIGDITYSVTIPIDHVQDYDDFVNQMRQDGKFEKFIQSVTIDRINGGSQLSKNKYKW